MDRGSAHHLNDHHDHDDVPIACLACGYSRVGIEPHAVCPECGAPAPRVRDRAHAHPWIVLPITARDRARRGLMYVTAGIAGMALCLVAQLGLAFSGRMVGPTTGFGPQDLLNAIALIATLVTEIGWWIALPPAVVRAVGAPGLAHTVRATAVLIPACIAGLAWSGIGGALRSNVALALLIAFLVQVIVSTLLLKRLANGARTLSFGDSARLIASPIVIAALPFAVFGTTLGIVLLVPYWLYAVAVTRLALREVLRLG